MKVSFCALCRDQDSLEYIKSEAEKIFPNDTEYLLINYSKNELDCYKAIRLFLANNSCDLIIVSHDDIRFGKLNFKELAREISNIVEKDNKAILFGVAGCNRNHIGAGHFYDGSMEHKWGFPDMGKVESLDEMFLVIRGGNGLTISEKLSGFHFYGTDLCLNAQKIGKSAYAIDFPITHVSAGKMDKAFFEARDAFENHLRNERNENIIRTTCTYVYGGNSVSKKCESLVKSWKMMCGHTYGKIARDCINIRGFQSLGSRWIIIVKYLEYRELVRKYRKTIKATILRYMKQ